MTGQDGHRSAAVSAVAVLVAGTLLSAVGVAALRSDTASAPTVVAEAAGASLVLPDGTRRAAVAGERVPNGATVELPGPGRAVLVTRDRETHLARASAVRVVDGARQVLAAGTAFVDSADAPGLDLSTDAGTVSVREGALVRVDGGTLPRVGVLRADGEGAAVRASGRRTATDVPAYFQVQVPRGGLPGAVVPLRLTEGDAYEEQLAADLVAADRYLNDTGDALLASPAQASVVRAALVEVALPAAPSVAAVDREGALGYLVAAAAGEVRQGLPRVRELREQGGSWGVVAAIVGASVDEVGARLDALLAPTTVALPVAVADPADMPDLLGLGGSPAGPAPRPAPGASGGGSGSGSGGGSGGGGGGGGGEPTPPPPPDPDVVDTVTETVDTVVDTVLGLLPPPPSAPAPVPSPAPASEPLVELDTPLLDVDLLG